MKVVCISDTHTQERHLKMPEGDILIHAGDATYFGGQPAIASFNDWLGELKREKGYKHIVFCPGNHDLTFEKDEKFARALLTNATVLINEPLEIEGIKIWGSPVTPEFFDWAFNVKRGADIKKYWDMIPEGLDILVTHGPPDGILDIPYNKYETFKRHVGCVDLLNAVNEKKPRYHIFGHIHGSPGTFNNGTTQFINAAMCSEKYKIVNTPYELEF